MFNKKFIKQLILLSTLSIINKTKADHLCLSNSDCAKFNTDIDTFVCIRFDGQADYSCYPSSEAYCHSDVSCQEYHSSLKYCYVPPWSTNSQKQCFSVHDIGGACVENHHCADGLTCQDNICGPDLDSITGGSAIVKTNADIEAGKADTGTNLNASSNINTNTNTNSNSNTDGNTDTNTSTDKVVDSSTNSTSNANTAKTKAKTTKTKGSNYTSTIDLDDDENDKKKKPIEILGLPLWLFILLITVPIIFFIAILWGLAIGRKSYREEEERKKAKMALKNSKKDLDINYNGSSENLLPQSTSDLSLKEDMLKNYIQSEGRKKSHDAVASNASSNSTIGNNLTAVTVEGKGKTSPHLEVPKSRKPRKSSATSNSEYNIPPKPKKPKSIVSSEFSDSNSHKGLLSAGQPMGISAAESGVYSNYFGSSGAGSAISASYFSQPMQADPAMTALYYQQYMAAQAQQAAAAQQYMTQYYMENNMAMPTVDMMQYQQMYGMGMAYPGTEAAASGTAEKKHKHKGGK
ncbi:hypothetical protein PIROE2DRAFT_63744 [Piromyces sp. E2]|nr:hypothetical protein PIROE2DRAFT_63744 [Piromyces sp. E2]|eukprot:OUM59480.1 hypothetical protein PIROE2DRAFT_63744 [Piromyces sp. E2]